jgi:hypothetical protein
MPRAVALCRHIYMYLQSNHCTAKLTAASTVELYINNRTFQYLLDVIKESHVLTAAEGCMDHYVRL